MQDDAPDQEALRRLAGIRFERPVVLSLYLNLDPSEFATPPARATAVRSLLDAADRELRKHEEKADLKASLDGARTRLTRNLDAEGAQALALFACEPEGMLETIKLPRPVPSRVAVGRSPLIGPLAKLARRERWCVTLVSRRDARVFRGSPDGLREVDQIHDDVHGQHDQGGMSQARYQRSVEKEVADHLKRSAERLLRHFKRQPFERLVLGGPREVVAEFESHLHAYLSDRLAGRVEVDVDTASAERVLEVAREHFEEVERSQERDAMERVEQGSRAASTLEDVLRALNERRVETLLLGERFQDVGTFCLVCGWLGPEGPDSCPADGTPLERCDDLAEAATELALQGAADVLPLRGQDDIAALLRF